MIGTPHLVSQMYREEEMENVTYWMVLWKNIANLVYWMHSLIISSVLLTMRIHHQKMRRLITYASMRIARRVMKTLSLHYSLE